MYYQKEETILIPLRIRDVTRVTMQLLGGTLTFAFLLGSVRCISSPTANEILSMCDATMSEVDQYRVDAGSIQMVVSTKFDEPRKKIRMEAEDSKGTTIWILTDKLCVEYYPDDRIAFDKTFVREGFQNYTGLFSDFSSTVTSALIESHDDNQWVISYELRQQKGKLTIQKKSFYPIEKEILDDDTKPGKTQVKFKFSDFVSGLHLSDEHFALPSNTTIESAKDAAEFVRKRLAGLERYRLQEPFLQKLEPDRKDPDTGRLIPSVPAGKTRAEFAKDIAKAMRRLPAPDGMTEARKNEIADGWETNTQYDLDFRVPVRSVPVPQEFGTWKYLLLLTILVTLIALFLRSNMKSKVKPPTSA